MNEEDFSLKNLARTIHKFSIGHKEFRENYRDSFSLSGGEPTLHPDLPGIIKTIDRFFPSVKIILLSNGRKFISRNYAEGIVRSHSNLEFIIPIHAHRAQLHDEITAAKGSFLQTVKGIKNILKTRKTWQKLEIRIVIHRLNYEYLPDITKFINKEFPGHDRLIYLFFEIEGKAKENLKTLKLSYSELLPHISNICVRRNRNNTPEPRLYHFPLCVIPKKLYQHTWRTLPDFEVEYPDACHKCTIKRFCLGVLKEYLKYGGGSEFHPVDTTGLRIDENLNWHNPIKGIHEE